MITRLKALVQERYRFSAYETQIKSVLLLNIVLIIVIFLPCLYVVNTFRGYAPFGWPLLIIPMLVFFILIGLVLLCRGSYSHAVNFIIIALTVSIIVNFIVDTMYRDSTTYHVNTFFYIFAIIAFVALFAGWRWLIILPLVFLAFGILYYLSFQERLHLPSKGISGVLVDLSFALIFVSSISFMIKRVNELVVRKLEEYNERLRREMDERIALEKEMLSIHETVSRKIGQDIHDDLGQHLVSIKMRGEILRDRFRGKFKALSLEADRIMLLIEQAIEKTGRIVKGMGLIDLDAHNFISALRALCADIEEMHGITCSLRYERTAIVFHDMTAINLYRIAQESITNAIKHGTAKQIQVELSAGNGAITLSVESDGKPFSGPLAFGAGLGLRIMRYRADLMGGELSVMPRVSGGTIVRCSVPGPRAGGAR